MGRKQTQPAPIHSGDVLADRAGESGLTANAFGDGVASAREPDRAILKGQRGITGDTALRLGRYFGTSAGMWTDLRPKLELAVAGDELRHRIEREVLPRTAAPAGRRRVTKRGASAP